MGKRFSQLELRTIDDVRLAWIGKLQTGLTRVYPVVIVYPDEFPQRSPQVYPLSLLRSGEIRKAPHTMGDGSLCLSYPHFSSPHMTAADVADGALLWLRSFENFIASGRFQAGAMAASDTTCSTTNLPAQKDVKSEYDVVLSFAGEDREYVKSVANILRGSGVRVFYDKYEQVDLWGKDLYTHLHDVYKNKSRYCVMFISRHYREKLWTNHERESAQARAFLARREYVLPVRLDDTEIPGINPTVGYVLAQDTSPEKLAAMIQEKLDCKPDASNMA